MKHQKKSAAEILDRSLARLGDPSTPSVEQMDSAGERVLQRLRSEAAAPESLMRDSSTAGRVIKLRQPAFAAAAVIFAALVLMAIVVQFPGSNRPWAIVETANGGLYRISGTKASAVHVGDRIEAGETIRSTFGEGAMLVLGDGTRVEMRSGSEVVLEAERDGAQIGLHGGSVIVSAAHQRTGHLYVKTKHCTVSVTGTVFLVKAEDQGSRVAVIEGEVQVEHSGTSSKLLPGQQVATSSAMISLGMVDEISWSTNLNSHLTELQRATAFADIGRLNFHSIWINSDPGRARERQNSRSSGLACHGSDEILRAPIGNATPFDPPEGACIGNNVPLAEVIAFAYNVPRYRVSGGPDWLQNPIPAKNEEFQIEARTEDLSATGEQLRQMLRSLLEDRFKLEQHQERREFSGHVLAAEKGNLKLRETSDREAGPSEIREDNRLIITGKTSMRKLAAYLSDTYLGLGVVEDQTDLTGTYEYTLKLNAVAAPPKNRTTAESAVPNVGYLPSYDPSILSAFREQLGLTLKPEKVPLQVIVVDQIEKPSNR